MKRLNIADINDSDILSKEEKRNIVGGDTCDENLGVRCVDSEIGVGGGGNPDGCYECKVLHNPNGFGLREITTYVLGSKNCSGQVGKSVETSKCFY